MAGRRRSSEGSSRRSSSSRSRGRSRKAKPASLRDLLIRRNGWYLWVLGLLWVGGLWWYPESTPSTRFSGTVFTGLLAAGLLALWWRYRVLRWGLLLTYLTASVFWFLPGSDRYDRVALREKIAAALREEEGQIYASEGESFRRLSEKGLFRRGLIKGTLRQGIQTLNPLLVRRAVHLWWSGQPDPLQPPRRELERLVYEKPLSAFDPAILYPGDLARLGERALFYLGNGLWIEASREEGRVTTLRLPNAETPLSIWRWRFLKARRP